MSRHPHWWTLDMNDMPVIDMDYLRPVALSEHAADADGDIEPLDTFDGIAETLEE